jgi:poly-gamma-glutamate capsule biosynthesis protein CapA/YwtB (metallophosphatase superfamily)
MEVTKILFAGDFAPCRRYELIVLEEGAAVLGDALPLVQSADISFVNLECPLTLHEQLIKKSGPSLRANPRCVNALRDFSVVGLANNHILDFGAKGLSDTIAACGGVGLAHVGAGCSIEAAQRPFVKEINGLKVAVIAVAEHEFNQSSGGPGSAPIDPIDNYHQIQKAKSEADVVIVTLHGGNEYFPFPRPGLRKLCKYYINLGVEAVICHHPHVPGAYEYYQGKPIVYFLGNLIFDSTSPPAGWNVGCFAQITINSQDKCFESLELIPYEQSVELGGVRLFEHDEKAAVLSKLTNYRALLEDDELYRTEWENLVFERADEYILRQYMPIAFRGLGFLARNFPLTNVLFSGKSRFAKLNMLRCQSHHELLTAVLEQRAKQQDP